MNRNTLKSLSVLLLALILILSACSKGGTNNTEATPAATSAATPEAVATEAPAEEKDVDLKVINFRVEDKAFYDDINKKFEEKYPYIHLKYDVVPTKDYTQLKTARITNGDVDVIASGGEQEVANPNSRETMADISGQPFFSNFIPDALKAGQWEGKQYFLPFSTIALVTFYNKQIFADAGLAVPTTWDEFIAVCEALKAKGIEPIMFGGKDQWPINMIIGELEAGIVRPGGQNADFYAKMKTEETKFTDASWTEVFTKLQVLGKYFQKNAAGLDYGQAPGLFAQGKAAMMIDGSWSLAQIEDAKPAFETGTFLLPGSNDPEANKVATTKFGFGWTIYKDTKNMDAALKYLEFLASTENYQQYNDMVRMLPVIQNAETKSPISHEVSQLLTNQMPLWESLHIPGAKYNYTQYGMDVILGRMKPEDAVKQMQKDLIDSKADWK